MCGDRRCPIPKSRCIRRAKCRFDDDPAVPLNLADLAKEVGLSRYQLLRGFARDLGLTPHAFINAAAEAYRGVIPPDRWHEPYMPLAELHRDIAAGVAFWGCESDRELLGVMGIQPAQDVDLIRHAYVRPDRQRHGVGAALITHLRRQSTRRMLVGTWATANWAIDFYRRHGFEARQTSRKAAPAPSVNCMRRRFGYSGVPYGDN